MLLRRQPQKEFTAAEVSKELYTTDTAVYDMLSDLARRGVVSMRKIDGVDHFMYNPRSGEIDRAVQQVEQCYSQMRVRIIDLIFSQPSNSVQSFAEAFKLRQDENK